MDIAVTAKPNARKTGVEKLPDGTYKVAVHSSPEDGKANAELIVQLSLYFDVPKSHIQVIRGHASRHKLVRLGEPRTHT